MIDHETELELIDRQVEERAYARERERQAARAQAKEERRQRLERAKVAMEVIPQTEEQWIARFTELFHDTPRMTRQEKAQRCCRVHPDPIDRWLRVFELWESNDGA